MVEMKLEGIETLKKEIRELNGNVHKAVLKGLKEGGKIVAKKANENATAHGFSQKKYFAMLGESKSLKKSEGTAGVKVGTKSVKGLQAPKKNRTKYYKEQGDYFYIRFPEYGTKKQRAKPSLNPAIKSEESKVIQAVEVSLKETTQKLSGIIKGE